MSDKDDEIRAIFESPPEVEEEDEEALGGAPGGPAPRPRRRVEADRGLRRRFPDISRRAWEHPSDRAAMVALRRLPGVDEVVRRVLGFVPQRGIRLFFLANAVRVDETQFADVYRQYLECCEILDVAKPPELYVTQTPMVNAGAVGIDEPFIVVNSGTIELLEPEELRFVLGHELGHVISDHALYRTMVVLVVRLVQFGFGLFAGRLALMALMMALLEWSRKAELSGDRAGLLCVQDPETAYRVHLKMAGGSAVEEMSVDAFVRQAAEYERGGGAMESVLKFLNLAGQTHPFAVLRLAELRTWVESGAYEAILSGEYPRRSEDDGVAMADEWVDAARGYRDRAESSEDPVIRFLQELGGNVARAGGGLVDQIGEIVARLRGERGAAGEADAAAEPAAGDSEPADDEGEDEPSDPS